MRTSAHGDNPTRITSAQYARSVLPLAAIIILATPSTPGDLLAASEAAMAALEYELAADQAMLAATAPGASDEEKVRANVLAGVAHRILGRDLEARINFRYVLLRAPGTRLAPDTPPKVALFFESVRQEVEAERAAQASATAPEPPHPASAPAAPSGLLIAGAVTGGAGALLLLGGAGGLALAETSLADPAKPSGERTSLRTLGQLSVAVGGAGVLLAGAGAVLLVVAAGDAP